MPENRNYKQKIRWGNFGNYVIRVELRKGPRNGIPIFYVAKEKGEKIDIVSKYEEVINNGIEVAYFIEIGKKSFGEVLREAVDTIKLIYRGYFKVRKNYLKNLNHAEK